MTISSNTLSRAVVLLTVIAVVFFLLLASGVGAGSEVRPAAMYVIQAGDTLWSIAERRTPPGGDVRTTVFDIKRINQMTDSVIHPGDELLVPLPS